MADPTLHVNVALDDGVVVTVAQAITYSRLCESQAREVEWHFCENGCCMCCLKDDSDTSGWVISQDGVMMFVDGQDGD